MKEFDLYSFVYRGILSEEALDRTGRRRRNHFGAEQARALQKSLSFDIIDPQLLAEGQRMSVIYTAIHAFENAVRGMVVKGMTGEARRFLVGEGARTHKEDVTIANGGGRQVPMAWRSGHK